MKLPDAIEIAALDTVESAVESWAWPFAQTRRADIDRHFADQQRERPALWNGRVLLLQSSRAGRWYATAGSSR
jgi:hypothetical protein